eukprot:1091572-Pleurochrysis_carterae.AAC.2
MHLILCENDASYRLRGFILWRVETAQRSTVGLQHGCACISYMPLSASAVLTVDNSTVQKGSYQVLARGNV